MGAHWSWERRNGYRQASSDQLCLHSIKKVSDSITRFWGLLAPNIWIFGRAPKTPGCCTSHLEVCRHLSAALTPERGAPGQARPTSSEGPWPRLPADGQDTRVRGTSGVGVGRRQSLSSLFWVSPGSEAALCPQSGTYPGWLHSGLTQARLQ